MWRHIAKFSFFVIAVLSVLRIISEPEIYPTGDAIEYSLMTEAFFNHFSPNVEASDYNSFKSEYILSEDWLKNDKAQAYEETENFIRTDHEKLEYGCAFFTDGNNKKYSVHFFFYSLINVPLRALCSFLHFNPLLVFQYTNVLLVIISCFVFLFYSPYDKFATSIFAFLFFFSTNYWYLSWAHPEVSTVCFVTVGLWLFFQKRCYWGIALVALASLQSQPLAILVLLLTVWTLWDSGLTVKNVIRVGICSFPVLIPSLFYYAHFGVTNLIAYQGALRADYVNFRRVFGFFFDLNQGMILAFPFILPAYLFLVVKRGVKGFEAKWDILILFCIILIPSVAASINNWNHGQAIVNRYVTYVGAVVLVHFFVLVHQLNSASIKRSILAIALLSQIATVIYFQKMNVFDWSTNTPKPIANWVLDNYPQLYNPDPTIFIARYAEKQSSGLEEVPILFYMNKDGAITKFLIREGRLNELESFGLSSDKVDSLSKELSFVNGWTYLNLTSDLKKNLSTEKIQRLFERRKIIKIESKIKEIKSNKVWFEFVKEKALQLNIPIDSALFNDAKWEVEKELKN